MVHIDKLIKKESINTKGIDKEVKFIAINKRKLFCLLRLCANKG